MERSRRRGPARACDRIDARSYATSCEARPVPPLARPGAAPSVHVDGTMLVRIDARGRKRSRETWPAAAEAGRVPRMHVLTIANQKGGSGKTTTSTNVAAALHRDGLRVVILDIDPQGSSLAWASRAAELGHVGPSCYAVTANQLRPELAKLESLFDVAIIDSPAKLGTEARTAMMLADLVVIPVIPGPYDLWSTEETMKIVEEARAFRPELRAVSFLNRADRTALSKKCEKALEGLGVEPLGVRVAARTAFGEAALLGRGVVDAEPKSEAAADVRRLVRALRDALAGKGTTTKTVAA